MTVTPIAATAVTPGSPMARDATLTRAITIRDTRNLAPVTSSREAAIRQRKKIGVRLNSTSHGRARALLIPLRWSAMPSDFGGVDFTALILALS